MTGRGGEARAALIGLGMVAGTHAAAIAESRGVRLASVFSRGEAARRAFAERHGAAPAASVEAIAADPSIDFAILATPPDAREGPLRILAGAGKPVLMEKPVERDLPRARALVDLCEARGVPLGIVLQHRARPLARDLRRRLPELGPIRMVEARVPWWRPQSYYDEPGRGSYARDGGGVLVSQAIHTLDLMLSLAGPVAEVTAHCATTALHEMEGEDLVSAGLTFASGAQGVLTASTAAFPGEAEEIALHGEEGSARLGPARLRIDMRSGACEEIGADAGGSGAGADPMAFTHDWHRAVIEDFAEALREGRAPMVTGREALGVHRLIGAIEASSRQGRRLKVEGAR